MSYLDDYNDIQKNIEESRFNETADYLVKHFEYINDVARNQSETSRGKLSGVLVGILSNNQYQNTLVKYDASENIVLHKRVDADPNGVILDISDNRAIRIPIGPTADRPPNPINGLIRINSTTNGLELYSNGAWSTQLNTGAIEGYVQSYVDSYIVDISQNMANKINIDISNVIGCLLYTSPSPRD